MKRLEPIAQIAHEAIHDTGWPWQVIGVFASVDGVESGDSRPDSGFLYTIGLNPLYDVWMPVASVEGRMIGFDLGGTYLNFLAFGTIDATLRPGDDVLCGVGIPGEDGEWERDADLVFWLGEMEENTGRRQTFQSHAPRILPILWSSPLGWREEPDEN